MLAAPGETIEVATMAMTKQGRSQSVVVGIDGSQAALDAATWAVAEAVNLGVPLRLVYVSAANIRAARELMPLPPAPNTPNRLYIGQR